MTGYPRTARINDLIRAELADLLRRKVKDPRVGSVSVTAVITAPDLSHARVMVSLLDPSSSAAALEGLRRAAGFLRGELGRRLRLKKAPELSFELDQTVEASTRMDQLLESLAEERPEESNHER
jgi:ribosome-binding factor A